MRQAITILLIIDAIWMILGSTFRVAIMLTQNQEIDAVPFISATLGATTLALLAFNRRTITGDTK